MAIKDRSVGPLYSARYKLPHRWCRPFTCGIVQMVHPWRAGRAFALPSGPFRSTLLFGIWKKKPIEDYVEDLEDEQWLGGRSLDNVTIEDIANWSAGPDGDMDQEEAAAVDGDAQGAPASG